MMARDNITDRAHRYRANELVPVVGKSCLLCGSTKFLVPDHWDGHPDHTHAENLEVLCKACNTAKGSAFKSAGRGRLTKQYNPTGGAKSVGQWMQAVGAITPHIDRGDRGLVSDMDVRAAVDMIRATPQSRRRDFAAKLRRHANPANENEMRARLIKLDRLMERAPERLYAEYEAEYASIKRALGEQTRAKSNPWPFSRPDARRTTPASGGIAHHTAKRRPATAKKAAGSVAGEKGGVRSLPDERTIQEGFKRGLTLNEILAGNPALRAFKKANPSAFDRCVKAVAAKGTARDPRAVCAAAGRAKYGQAEMTRRSMAGKKRAARNPAAASAEAFEEFHGYRPSEVITVTKQVHYHKHLAAAGKLTHLEVWGVDERGHKISGFKGALLAFNENKNQLFVEGGDQRINLDDFGIDSPHELETLGRVTDIGYHTNKTHLGSEGGEAVYVHRFRTTNDNGKHVVVRIARYPDLIYDVRNEQLLFSGGSYEILREGIDK